jgi:hypothetical protein
MMGMTAGLAVSSEVSRHHRSLDLVLRVQVWATWLTGALLLAALLWSWTQIGAVTGLFDNIIALDVQVMLGLSVVATLLGTWITALLYGWCRAYLGQVAQRASGQAVNLECHAALSRTLSAYITATQWALPVGLLILIPLSLYAVGLFVNSIPGLGIGALELTLLGLSAALMLAAPILLNNLILAAVRRWLTLSSTRLRGESSPPITPAAQAAGYWFIFCAVLLGLNVLSSLSAVPALAIGPAFNSFLPSLDLSALPMDRALLGRLITGAGVLIGAASLLGAVQNGLLLWLMLASRSFALSTAAVLDTAVLDADSSRSTPSR